MSYLARVRIFFTFMTFVTTLNQWNWNFELGFSLPKIKFLRSHFFGHNICCNYKPRFFYFKGILKHFKFENSIFDVTNWAKVSGEIAGVLGVPENPLNLLGSSEKGRSLVSAYRSLANALSFYLPKARFRILIYLESKHSHPAHISPFYVMIYNSKTWIGILNTYWFRF